MKTILKLKKKIPFNIKKIYRLLCWSIYNILTLGQAKKNLISIDTKNLIYGFKGHFSPFFTLRFKKSGDWDKKIILIEDHIVFKTMKDRYILNKEWEETEHYKMAMEKVRSGESSLESKQELDLEFQGWDALHETIKKHGFKSNRELYKERKLDNIVHLIDEITVNVSRDGTLILNDGWHRFIIAKMLGIQKIPVRILLKHSLWKGKLSIEKK